MATAKAQEMLNCSWFQFLQTNTVKSFRWWQMSVTKPLLGTRTGLFLRLTLQVEQCLSTCSTTPWKRYEAAPHAASWIDRMPSEAPGNNSQWTVYGAQHLERAQKIKAWKSNHSWSSFLLRKAPGHFVDTFLTFKDKNVNIFSVL